MDLQPFLLFLQACSSAQAQLSPYHHQFIKVSAFGLFKCLATKSQPVLTQALIKDFIVLFNWENHFNDQSKSVSNEKWLNHGIQLLIGQWGTKKGITFQEFCLLVKGTNQLPDQKDVSFVNKTLLYQCIINQIKSLLHLEQLKKKIYNFYKNLSDLFQTITSTRDIGSESVKRVFLSFSKRISSQECEMIMKRAKMPWDFSTFLQIFRANSKKDDVKIYYSSQRNKKSMNENLFTTPRKQKQTAQPSSTKVTKNYNQLEEVGLSSQRFHEGQNKSLSYYLGILWKLLKEEQNFDTLCSSLIKRVDFDLQLVFQKHGKKFQDILNERYGVCNFSAFVRFIIPKDYEHRYLSFTRYQDNDTLSIQTSQQIDSLIQEYFEKEQKILEIWSQCDKQMLLHNLCLPKDNIIDVKKLNEYFSIRQAEMLLERLDPHKLGIVSLKQLK